MPSLIVRKPHNGFRPSINEDAAKIPDQEGNRLFLYGGVRMRKNRDHDSPTTRPTNDFYSIDLITMEWLRHETIPSTQWLRNPFKPGPVDKTRFRIPISKELPVLQDPVGTIIQDRNRHSVYILLLGDPIDKHSKDGDHPREPALVCIDFTAKTWIEVPLKKGKNVEGGRARASMLVLGEIGGPYLKLFVFGGINNFNLYDKPTCRETIAVADLHKGSWIRDPEFVHVPPGIGPFGASPAVVPVIDSLEKKEKILIVHRANPEDSDVLTRRAFLFDPDKGNFELLEFEGRPFPALSMDDFVIQSTAPDRSEPEEINTLFFVGWNRRRLKGDQSFYATIQLHVMQMKVRFFRHANLNESSPRQLPSPLSSRQASPAATTRADILIHKVSFGRGSGQGTSGRNLFDTPFVVETACVRRKRIVDYDSKSGERVEKHESAKVMLLGFSQHEDFIGDVRLKCYNAFTMVTLKPLLEQSEPDAEESDDLRQEIFGSDNETSSSRSDSDSDSDSAMVDTFEETVENDDNKSISSSSSEETGSSYSEDTDDENDRRAFQAPPVYLAPTEPRIDPHFDHDIANRATDDMLLPSSQNDILDPENSLDLELTSDMMLDPFGQGFEGMDEFINGDFMVGTAMETDVDMFEP